jgi:hypothetical protein
MLSCGDKGVMGGSLSNTFLVKSCGIAGSPGPLQLMKRMVTTKKQPNDLERSKKYLV